MWAGDTLTVHAESYKGLVADALVAKLVTAPTGGVTLPALSAAGPLVVRFSTDAHASMWSWSRSPAAHFRATSCASPR